MLLSHKTSVKLTEDQANIIGHMCYAASKLWNVCNYERLHYKKAEPDEYPDWYYQKKAHKDDLWYKQLPSQTAQEVCKLLDKAWKSFISCREHMVLQIQTLQDSNRRILQSLTCRTASFIPKVTVPYDLRCRNS